MINRKLLGIYLNDHLAGSTAGMEVAKRSAGSNKGTGYGAFLRKLAKEIEQDRDEPQGDHAPPRSSARTSRRRSAPGCSRRSAG